jgi:environmental stress-induced protein Ves
MRIVRLNEIEPRPWKNGGGLTWEIAAGENAPPEWRLSVALIDRSGRFSEYAGYDRTILSISGGPVQLEIDGRRFELRHGEPFAFRGEANVAGILCGPPARDLNVMTQRDRFTHDVKIIAAPEAFALSNGDVGFACVVRGRASAGSERFTADECLSFDGADGSVRIAPETGASVCVVRIHRLESSSKR